mmetsp:Transcript_4091/g.6135  ORF Transcript_4091/g.6135 Transcript_4091/m.6135 type:complete len:513 (+) Transcript_4091:88-1626(+)
MANTSPKKETKRWADDDGSFSFDAPDFVPPTTNPVDSTNPVQQSTNTTPDMNDVQTKLGNLSVDTSSTTTTTNDAASSNDAAPRKNVDRKVALDMESDAKRTVVVEQSDPNSPLFSADTFEDLKLRDELLKAVYAMSYQRPSKIQSTALPLILQTERKNLIAQAQSGTGKTATFSLGILSTIDESKQYPQALCILPTRELSRQVYEVICALGRFLENVKIRMIIKGEKFNKAQPLKEQVIVGTPGTMLDLCTQRVLRLQRVRIFVLDEADEMMRHGGASQLSTQTKKLKARCPKDTQILCFSATYPENVLKFATALVPQPVDKILLKTDQVTVKQIQQLYIECTSERHKYQVLGQIYSFLSVGQSMIFVRTRKTAMSLHAEMSKAGYTVSVITGGQMHVKERDRVFDEFRDGKTKVLICTNVLARGIDVAGVSLIINYDMPTDRDNKPDYANYIHRVGRTGRFGREGIAINLVHDKDSKSCLQAFQKKWGNLISKFEAENIPKLEKMLKQLK